MKEKRNYTVLILTLLLWSGIGFSQAHKSKVKKYIRNGDVEMYNNNLFKALGFYKQAYLLDTNNAQTAYKVGVCMYVFRKYKKQSLPYFEKARKAGMTEALYYLGNLYHLNERFEDAITAFKECKEILKKKEYPEDEVDILIAKSRTAIEFKQAPVTAIIENLGRTVNSEYPDYVPLISADESVLIFTSRRAGSTGNLLDPLGDYFEDVYISEKKDSAWTTPKSISANINTATHDACVGLSADGELLFLYRTSEDLLSGDLYSSVFDGKDWTVPAKLPAPINSADYTEPSIAMSAEGQTLYFSSNRPGGFGKKDIYKVIRLPNGEWSQPQNMGPNINTADDEDALFIHPDGRTFYFSSKGHKNMGGYDIFKSSLKDGVWTEPENLGYPINTADDDVFFVLSTDGKKGYYATERPNGLGGSDIYAVNFPDEDFGLSVFNGLVMEDSTSLPVSARVSLFDSKTNKLIGIYNTNKLTGKFIMIFKPGKEYFIKAEAEGYASFVGTIDTTTPEGIKKILLRRIEK